MKSTTIEKQETLEAFKAICPNFYTESDSGDWYIVANSTVGGGRISAFMISLEGVSGNIPTWRVEANGMEFSDFETIVEELKPKTISIVGKCGGSSSGYAGIITQNRRGADTLGLFRTANILNYMLQSKAATPTTATNRKGEYHHVQ